MVTDRSSIPYEEHRAIAQLVRAHLDEHQGRLRGMAAFGDLITRGDTYDIDLLEVVENWNGRRYFEFDGTHELPLRGKLRLYFLRPEEFADPSATKPAEDLPWVESLVQRVREGYATIVEVPAGSIDQVLNPRRPFSTRTAPASGIGHAENALRLSG
jgi:hypothetical protein